MSSLICDIQIATSRGFAFVGNVLLRFLPFKNHRFPQTFPFRLVHLPAPSLLELQEPCCKLPRSANVASWCPRWTKDRPESGGGHIAHGSEIMGNLSLWIQIPGKYSGCDLERFFPFSDSGHGSIGYEKSLF